MALNRELPDDLKRAVAVLLDHTQRVSLGDHLTVRLAALLSVEAEAATDHLDREAAYDPNDPDAANEDYCQSEEQAHAVALAILGQVASRARHPSRDTTTLDDYRD